MGEVVGDTLIEGLNVTVGLGVGETGLIVTVGLADGESVIVGRTVKASVGLVVTVGLELGDRVYVGLFDGESVAGDPVGHTSVPSVAVHSMLV